MMHPKHLDNHRLAIIIISVVSALVVAATIVTITVYFTIGLGHTSQIDSCGNGVVQPQPGQLKITAVNAAASDTDYWYGYYNLHTSSSTTNLLVNIEANDADSTATTFTLDDYVASWVYNSDNGSLTFAIAKNTSNINPDSPYVALLGNGTEGSAYYYCFGDSTDPTAYSLSNNWVEHATGTAPMVVEVVVE